jgi:hypothetical protein
MCRNNLELVYNELIRKLITPTPYLKYEFFRPLDSGAWWGRTTRPTPLATPLSVINVGV